MRKRSANLQDSKPALTSGQRQCAGGRDADFSEKLRMFRKLRLLDPVSRD